MAETQENNELIRNPSHTTEECKEMRRETAVYIAENSQNKKGSITFLLVVAILIFLLSMVILPNIFTIGKFVGNKLIFFPKNSTEQASTEIGKKLKAPNSKTDKSTYKKAKIIKNKKNKGD
jgi:flagellar basal body-associated protein FliL